MRAPRWLTPSRIGAHLLLLIAISSVWLLVIGPLFSAWNERVDQADRLADMVARLQRTAAETPEIERELGRVGAEQRAGSGVWAAQNPVLAGASLQSEVRRIVEAAGAEAQSFQPLPAKQERSLTQIGLRVNLQSDTGQIARILYALESHRPVILVRTLSIRGNEQPQPATQSSVLSVELEVSSFTAGPG